MEVYKVLINGKMTDISELKVTELKAELKKRGVSTTGSKKDLYEKLKNVSDNSKHRLCFIKCYFWFLFSVFNKDRECIGF